MKGIKQPANQIYLEKCPCACVFTWQSWLNNGLSPAAVIHWQWWMATYYIWRAEHCKTFHPKPKNTMSYRKSCS